MIPDYRDNETLYEYRERIAPMLVGSDLNTIKDALHKMGLLGVQIGFDNAL